MCFSQTTLSVLLEFSWFGCLPDIRVFWVGPGQKADKASLKLYPTHFSLHVTHFLKTRTWIPFRNHHLFPFQELSTRVVTTVLSTKKQLGLQNGLSVPTAPKWGGQLPRVLMMRAGLHSFYNFESIFGFTIE